MAGLVLCGPPTSTLLVQAALAALVSAGSVGGYCGTQLLSSPLSHARMRRLAQTLDAASLPAALLLPPYVTPAGLPLPGASAGRELGGGGGVGAGRRRQQSLCAAAPRTLARARLPARPTTPAPPLPCVAQAQQVCRSIIVFLMTAVGVLVPTFHALLASAAPAPRDRHAQAQALATADSCLRAALLGGGGGGGGGGGAWRPLLAAWYCCSVVWLSCRLAAV